MLEIQQQMSWSDTLEAVFTYSGKPCCSIPTTEVIALSHPFRCCRYSALVSLEQYWFRYRVLYTALDPLFTGHKNHINPW